MSQPPDDGVDAPTEAAYLKLTTIGSTTVEVRGTVPLICVASILGAVAVAYIGANYAPAADMAWFLGLAAIVLTLSGLVVLRITRRPARKPRLVAPADRSPDERA